MKTTAEMLRAIVETLDRADVADEENEGDDTSKFEAGMRDMLDRHSRGKLFRFSPKQEKWIRETYEKVFDEPQYENAFSAGKVPLGEKLRTPVPDVLKKPLPLKPPGRR
jgi:hypothetical protein